MKTVKCLSCLIALVVSVLGISQKALAVPFSDFDDGTMQGWDFEFPGGGTAELRLTGGNPGGFVELTDTSGSIPMSFIGPAEFRGNLSVYDGIQWDEIIYEPPAASLSTAVGLRGVDGTRYIAQSPLIMPSNQWNARFVPFEESAWMLITEVSPPNPSSFEDVLKDCAVWVGLDVHNGLVLEGGVDNIKLVPEPGTAILIGLAGLWCVRRKRTRLN